MLYSIHFEEINKEMGEKFIFSPGSQTLNLMIRTNLHIRRELLWRLI